MMPVIIAILSGLKITSSKVGKLERKVSCATVLATVPTSIDTRIPTTDPQKPSKIASIEKLKNTLLLLIPIAFIKPISRVRSWTAMNNVLMMPIAAASSAMPPKILNTTIMAAGGSFDGSLTIQENAAYKTATAALLRKVFPANGDYRKAGWSKEQLGDMD